MHTRCSGFRRQNAFWRRFVDVRKRAPSRKKRHPILFINHPGIPDFVNFPKRKVVHVYPPTMYRSTAVYVCYRRIQTPHKVTYRYLLEQCVRFSVQTNRIIGATQYWRYGGGYHHFLYCAARYRDSGAWPGLPLSKMKLTCFLLRSFSIGATPGMIFLQ